LLCAHCTGLGEIYNEKIKKNITLTLGPKDGKLYINKGRLLMDDFLKMDGYDDCIVGVVERFGQNPILCYDKNKVLNKLQQDGMSEDEALEFFEFNQIGAYMGENTPCFITMTDLTSDPVSW
jgi:hypothetical protein